MSSAPLVGTSSDSTVVLAAASDAALGDRERALERCFLALAVAPPAQQVNPQQAHRIAVTWSSGWTAPAFLAGAVALAVALRPTSAAAAWAER